MIKYKGKDIITVVKKKKVRENSRIAAISRKVVKAFTKVSNDKSALTILELIITMAMLTILVAVVFSIYISGIRSMAKSEDRSTVQFNGRLAALSITNEVRFAAEVELLPSVTGIPEVVTGNESYIFKDTNGSTEKIVCRDKNGDRVLADFTGVDLSFTTEGVNKNLYFNIQGAFIDEVFDIDTKVLPLNMPRSNTIINTDGLALRFVKSIPTPQSETLYIQGNSSQIILNEYYEFPMTVSGGIPVYDFSVINGDLPPGMVLNAATGIISGTPNITGIYNFRVYVTDSSEPMEFGSRTFTITVTDTEYSTEPGTKPSASNVLVKKNGIAISAAAVGDVLEGTYTYSPDNGTESGTTFQWYRSKKSGDVPAVITGAIYRMYTATENDKNHYLYFQVTPGSSVEPYVGDSVTSSSVEIKNK